MIDLNFINLYLLGEIACADCRCSHVIKIPVARDSRDTLIVGPLFAVGAPDGWRMLETEEDFGSPQGYVCDGCGTQRDVDDEEKAKEKAKEKEEKAAKKAEKKAEKAAKKEAKATKKAEKAEPKKTEKKAKKAKGA